jgi:transcriptional regulator with XRE-family HTH domain
MTQLLNSQKEIAAYFGRGVRTVQRWERDLRLPVQPPREKNRSAGIAFTYELDHWLKHTDKGPLHVNQKFCNVVPEPKLLRKNRALEQNIQLL